MIVEFIGCSGAGKTTLAREIERIGGPRPAIFATELVVDHPGLRWISDPTAVNLVADVISFPPFLRALGHEKDFVRFAFDRLRRHAPSSFAKYNYMLNVVRKLGVHEMARRAAPRKTVLIDEGAVLSAYQLFVYSGAPFDHLDLERFARLVPLPDRIVYVRAPIDLLVDRAMTRPDQRRELARRGPSELRWSLERAIALFESLAKTEPIRDRLLTVDVGDDSSPTRDAAVREISRFLSQPTRAPGTTRSDDPERLAGTVATDARPGTKRIRLIAFVGSEASGKSTILDEVGGWLGRDHEVRRIHAGKPPSTPVTYVPHVLLPALRRLFPEQRSLRVEARFETDPRTRRRYSLLFALRSVMLAYERRTLITRALARSGNGTVVLSDRYPSRTGGAPDGPQLGHLPLPPTRLSARRVLATVEDRLYRDIPVPDLVFHLTAPLDVTLARNAAREKIEPEEYVRFRHAISSDLRFDGTIVHRIDTDRELGDVLHEIERAIGDATASAGAEARRGSA
jgi:thymidylate kinase